MLYLPEDPNKILPPVIKFDKEFEFLEESRASLSIRPFGQWHNITTNGGCLGKFE